MENFVDHYQVMRVGLSASDAEIKQAYMMLSRAFHPDRYNGPDATATFQLIGNSYAILKDKSLRKAYDIKRQQIMGNREWAFPEDSKRDQDDRNSPAENRFKGALKKPKSPIKGIGSRLTFSSENRPDGAGRPRRHWRPKPELQTGLYTIFEEEEDQEDQENQQGQEDVEFKEPTIPAERMVTWYSGNGRLFNPASFMPARSSWIPRMHTPARTFLSWKASELRVRNVRVKKWQRLATELLGQIELRRQGALRQQVKAARFGEDLKIEIEVFKIRKEEKGQLFQNQHELDQALLKEKWFKDLREDKANADKKMTGMKISIRMFMDQLQDHQDDFEHAEHKALIAVANKVLTVLDKDEYISDKDPRDVEKSKIEWTKLKHIGVTSYQKYRQPVDIQKACQVAWKHKLAVEEEDFNEVRMCKRCNRDVFFNCYTCKNCASFMCSTCNDRVHQLQKYHAWLEEENRSDDLFGV